MSESRNRLIFAAFLAALPACSLFVSLDDLQEGGAGSGDASTNDAASGTDVGADAGGDSIAPLDAGADADADIFFDDFDRPD
ncbi:MAG: hypothetical protein ACREJX_16775, partial [Polyangiaceae bacterium]